MGTPTLSNSFSGQVTIKLGSCHGTWYFQPARMRFRRAPGAFRAAPHLASAWRPYYGLQFDDELDRFTVLLSPDGTRLARSWRHQVGSDACEHCAETPTAGLARDGIRQLAEEHR